jgi:hypothetical protein
LKECWKKDKAAIDNEQVCCSMNECDCPGVDKNS